jgi:colanic acid biosynthesis protein WcaH
MDTRDDHLPEDVFRTCLGHVPQVCIDLVVGFGDGVLLTRRTNEPAKGAWFWPGGRVYKGERLDDAARRIAREEVGLQPAELSRLGVSEHFWERTSVQGLEDRHTVPIIYRVRPEQSSGEVQLDDQHDDFRVLRSREEGLHRYVREYLDRFDLV